MQKIIQHLFKAIIKGVVVSFVIATLAIVLEVLFGRKLTFDNAFMRELGYYALYGVVLTVVNSLYFSYLNTKVKWERHKKYRLVISAFGSVLLTVLGIFFIRLFLGLVIENITFEAFIKNEEYSFYYVSLLITLVFSLFFHAVYFYKLAQENKVKEQKVLAGTANAQFESLKNQIDPHFLFNSLNVLSSLIEENPENAQRFTTSLSKIYRYVLEQKDKELVSVQEELEFAKTYMNLLKMRFEDSISYELPNEMGSESLENEAKVVPLSLQLLLENTIKHNIVSEQKPLHIRIYISKGYLIIENNLQRKEVLQDRKGVGLQNIVNRYALLSERKVMVEETLTTFIVKIPILTKQLVKMETQNRYNENMAYIKAKERVEKIKGFYGNLTSYCIVIPVLIFINFKTGGFKWFWFPMMGWGLGLMFHFFDTFGFGKSWEERKIQVILNKDNQNKWG